MPLPPEVLPLVRNFANNSFRFLFHQPGNVADLVRWRTPRIARGIDFSELVVQPETFVTPGFTELESDVLLQAPWRTRGREQSLLQVYILIEHQSEPDEHAVFRAVQYVVQVYDKQVKQWLREHSNTRGMVFDPVLPLVFYSGTRNWPRLRTMRQLVHHGNLFGALLPALEPVFVNLARTEPALLQSRAGLFGWVLWLIQQQRRKEPAFRDVLRQVVAQVDRLHSEERGRWAELLWFAHALVYHARETPEREELADFIRSTVRQAEQPEVQYMGKTIAEALREEGIVEANRERLLRLLRGKFKQVPEAVTAEVQAEQDRGQLDAWFDAAVAARKFSDIPFRSSQKK
jgi:hypothetical protein